MFILFHYVFTNYKISLTERELSKLWTLTKITLQAFFQAHVHFRDKPLPSGKFSRFWVSYWHQNKALVEDKSALNKSW